MYIDQFIDLNIKKVFELSKEITCLLQCLFYIMKPV